MNAPFDPTAFKATTRDLWDRHAEGWNAHSAQIGQWLRQPTDAMLATTELGTGERVLDVAAGAGDQTVEIAKRVGPAGAVLATDLSPAILKLAEVRVRSAGYRNVETLVADGENLNVGGRTFDAVICRLGLMFFPDPARGLREMYRALKPGGRACAMVFGSPDSNPCVTILVSAALRHAGLPPSDPFHPGGLLSLGKPGLTDELFQRAGFSRVATTKVAAPFRLRSVKDYLDFVRNSASPILQILGRLDTHAKEAAWAEIESELSQFNTSDGWEGPNELLLTAGRRI